MSVSSLSKDSTAVDDYDSDHFSEIDTNEQVGNCYDVESTEHQNQ